MKKREKIKQQLLNYSREKKKKRSEKFTKRMEKINKRREKRSRKKQVFNQVFFSTLLLILAAFGMSIGRSENSPLWVLILFYGLPFLAFYVLIILSQMIYNERGRKYLKESHGPTNKENNETNHEEMNRSIRKVKKIKKSILIFYFLFIVLYTVLAFITSRDDAPIFIRLLVVSPLILFACYMPKVTKILEEENRKKFIEDTDEAFDKEQLMDEHKKIIKDLK